MDILELDYVLHLELEVNIFIISNFKIKSIFRNIYLLILDFLRIMIPIHTSSFDTAAEALINELIDLGSFYPDKYRPHSAPVLDAPSQNSRSSRRYHTTLDKAETNQYFFKETRSCIKFNSVRPESSKLQKVL